MALTSKQEEIREAIWQKHKTEETTLIREIEQAQRILKELQTKYQAFETRVTAEVDAAVKPVELDTVIELLSKVTITKAKVKCSVCKSEGHNKRSCQVSQIKIETISSK